MQNMDYILTTDNLCKQYKHVKAVDSINLHIKKGDIYGFIGRNGAGKTTTLKMLSGLAKPTSGSFSIFGCSKSELASGGLFAKIGILIEEPGFYPDMSAYDNLRMKCILMGYNDAAYAHGLLDTVGLAGAERRKVKTFSMGMKQRLGIAMALVGDPEVLILDEPINGLDPQGIAEIRNTILKLNRENGKTIIISSHILEELSKIATHYGIIDSGKLIAELTPEELSGKCESRIVIKVYDMEAACNLLHSINIHKFNIIDANTIHVYEHIEDSCQINMALCKADIFVSSIWVEQAGLEEFFFNMTGGGKNA